MIIPRKSPTCAMRGKDVFVFGGGRWKDRHDTLEFWNGIQWEIRMIPFKTAGSTLVSAGRTLYYLGTLHERHYELLNASNTFNLWRMNDNMVFLAVTKIVSIQPGEYYSTLILPLSFLTDCDGIPHCIGYCIYICFIFVLICNMVCLQATRDTLFFYYRMYSISIQMYKWWLYLFR